MAYEVKIYHDLQSVDDRRRLILNLNGTIRDLNKYDINLKEGLKLTFWSDDLDDNNQPDPLIVDGVVQFNPQINQWVALVDWHDIKHQSEFSAE
jgi:hypothetical protein